MTVASHILCLAIAEGEDKTAARTTAQRENGIVCLRRPRLR
jgi:hypothetical protein